MPFQIVFKNKASRPYSIYPHGLTLDKAGEGASYPAGGKAAVASSGLRLGLGI